MDVSPGQWIRRHRLARGLTQADLAKASACAAITIRKIEADERRPSAQMTRALAVALGLSPDDIEGTFRVGYGVVPSTSLATGVQSVTPTVSGTIPAPLHRLLGRSADLQALEGLLGLAGGPGRLVTVTGPPGVGKTRLVVEAALRIAGAGQAAVYLVDLAGVTEADFVLDRVVAALGIAVPVGGDAGSAVAMALSREPTLLVLDNAEQVLAVGPLLIRLLEVDPELCCLVTSRVRLDVYGEHVFDLPPLAEEGGAATELFLERARATRRDAELPADAVARICRRLDGLPLALELAASRLRQLDIVELEAELEAGLGVLHTTSALGDERHRTMTQAVEWCYSQAAPTSQRTLRAASWSVGPMDPDLLAVVVDRPRSAVESDLAQLNEAGLVRRSGSTYRMYEVVRSVAQERSNDHGESDGDRLAVAQALSDALRIDEPAVIGLDSPARLERIHRHHDDIVASIAWCLETPSRAGLGRDLLWQAGGYWLVRLVGTGEPVWLAEQALITVDDPRDADRARLLLSMLVLVSDPERARDLAREVQEKCSDAQRRADAQRMLILLLLISGDVKAALAELDDNRRRYSALGNEAGVGMAEMARGRVAGMRGDLVAFDAHLVEAIAAFTRAGCEVGRANALADKAEAAALAGHASAALRDVGEALETLVLAGAHWHAASYLSVVAAAWAQERPEVGACALGLCEAWLEDLGLGPHPFSIAVLERARTRVSDALGSSTERWMEEGASLPRTLESVRLLVSGTALEQGRT